MIFYQKRFRFYIYFILDFMDDPEYFFYKN
jgi:hypothetical protein